MLERKNGQSLISGLGKSGRITDARRERLICKGSRQGQTSSETVGLESRDDNDFMHPREKAGAMWEDTKSI